MRVLPGGKDREVLSEADIPATPSPAPQNARVSHPDADGERPARAEKATGEGAQPPDRLILRARDERLRCRKDFQRLYERGRTVRGRVLVMVFMPNERAKTRRGFVASGRIGNAVVRNRCKRLLREAYRQLRGGVELDGLDLVLIARPNCREAGIALVLQELEALYRAAGLWMSPTRSRGDPTEA